MAVMQVAPAVPTNPQARALFDRLRGSNLQEKMQRFTPTKLSPFFDALYTNIPALGKGVRTRQNAEYLLRHFYEGVVKLNDAEGKMQDSDKKRGTEEAMSRVIALAASKLYADAASHLELAGERMQADYCRQQAAKAEALSKNPEEQKQRPSSQATARPGGVRSGEQVKKEGKPRGGLVENYDWQTANAQRGTGNSHLGGLGSKG